MKTTALVEALRQGNFAAVAPLAAAFGSAVRAHLEQSLDTPARERIVNEALEELAGNLHLARVLRAHVAARLQHNAAAFLYQLPQSEQHCWQFEA